MIKLLVYQVVGLDYGDRRQRTLSEREHFQRRTMFPEMLIDVLEGVDRVAREEDPSNAGVPEVPRRVRQRVVAQVKLLQVGHHGREQVDGLPVELVPV